VSAGCIKRERNKKRPEEVDFWDFDCCYGANEASCGVIHVSEINKVISEADAEGLNSFFSTFHPLGDFLNPALALLGQGLKKSLIGQKLDFANHPYLCKGLMIKVVSCCS
jgi:hypothetical protein